MTTELRRKLEYSQNIKEYLAELELLLRRRVEREELLSLTETDELALKGPELACSTRSHAKLGFGALSQPTFRMLISQLVQLNSSGVYIWIPRTRVCGVLPPVALNEVDFGFPFDLNAAGILKLVSADFADSLLLELEQHQGHQKAELELVGRTWGHYDFQKSPVD